jgi:hypothetical protein
VVKFVFLLTDSTGLSPKPSGLRFRNLTSASTPEIPNGKVLSVSTNGDVIITTDQGITPCSSFSSSDINYVPKFTNTSPQVGI